MSLKLTRPGAVPAKDTKTNTKTESNGTQDRKDEKPKRQPTKEEAALLKQAEDKGNEITKLIERNVLNSFLPFHLYISSLEKEEH